MPTCASLRNVINCFLLFCVYWLNVEESICQFRRLPCCMFDFNRVEPLFDGMGCQSGSGLRSAFKPPLIAFKPRMARPVQGAVRRDLCNDLLNP